MDEEHRADVAPNGAARPQRAAISQRRLTPRRGLRIVRSPLASLTDDASCAGVVSYSGLGRQYVFAFGSGAVRELFTQPETFVADAFRELRVTDQSAMSRLSSGLLKLNGDRHRRHRQLMKPAFAARQVEKYTETIAQCAIDAAQDFEEGTLLDVSTTLSRLTLDVALRTIFDVNLGDEDGDAVHGLTTDLLRLGSNPLSFVIPFRLPGLPYQRLERTASELERVLDHLIEERRSSGDRDDLLGRLVSAVDDDGDGFTPGELVAEAYTAFCHESSAAALTWTFLLLDQHPDVLRDLREEVATHLRPGQVPTVEMLGEMRLLDRVIMESLRLFPPAAFGLRYAATDGHLEDLPVQAGATVFFSPFASHRDPEVFDQPLRFDPSRWLREKPTTYQYFPFGAGPHNCLGRSYALLEMRTILAVWLSHASLRTSSGTVVDPSVRISLVPKDSLEMTVRANHQVSRTPISGSINNFVDLN
ncbi:MAG: cytochrome P450 [Actinomycetota bacterium]|nr:cytochrome P450 [Actinomycetota bacterium]